MDGAALGGILVALLYLLVLPESDDINGQKVGSAPDRPCLSLGQQTLQSTLDATFARLARDSLSHFFRVSWPNAANWLTPASHDTGARLLLVASGC